MQNSNIYWWKSETNKIYENVFSYLMKLNNEQGYRQAANFKFMTLYGAQEVYGMGVYQGLNSSLNTAVANRVTLNVIQSMVDTVVSKIAKNKPRASFLTDGGDWSQQHRAKKLSQFVEGQFQVTDFYAKAARAFQDSCIWGTGCLKIFKKNGEIAVERIFIDEIIIDDKEALYGEPRQMHQRKMIHKDVLKDMFPKFKTQIDLLTINSPISFGMPIQANTDMITVIESWHLKSGPTAKDGLHTICIQNETLFAETYENDYFPFVFWKWGIRPLGFFGQGLSEQLSGIQLEINKILRTIQVSMHLISIPKIYVEAGSKIVSSHLDNKIGGIIKFAGTPPIPGQLGMIPPDLFNHLDRLYQRAYEIAGVSQLSATSAKPSGLDSGKALREYNDLETERFMSVAQRYEQVFMNAAKIMVELAKELEAESDEGYKVKVKGEKFLKTIKWKEVSMDEDQYIMSIFPTSALSSTPAGRLQDIQELIAAGFVGKEDAMKLLNFPDLQAFNNFETAPGADIDMCIERIVEDSEYMTPEPYQNLEYGIQKMQQAYLLFRSQNMPETKLELFRRWIEDANALIQRAVVDSQRQAMEAQQGMEAQAVAAMPEATPPPIAAEEIPPETMLPVEEELPIA